MLFGIWIDTALVTYEQFAISALFVCHCDIFFISGNSVHQDQSYYKSNNIIKYVNYKN